MPLSLYFYPSITSFWFVHFGISQFGLYRQIIAFLALSWQPSQKYKSKLPISNSDKDTYQVSNLKTNSDLTQNICKLKITWMKFSAKENKIEQFGRYQNIRIKLIVS